MSELVTPYLPEHSAPDNAEGSKPGYNPSAEEKEVLQLVDRMYSKAKKYRKRYDQKWIDFYKMFRGRQWKEVRPSYRHSEVLNLVFQTIQSMVPILTDSRPKLEFLPTLPDQFELADILNKVAENDWVHNNWLQVLTEILLDSHIYGVGLGHVGYNPKANMGLGNIEFESTDIFYFYPDPQAREINERRTKYIVDAVPTDITELKKLYPDKAKYIAADVIDFAQGDKADIYQVMFKSPVDSKLIIEGPSGYDSIAKNQSLKVTLYSKDDEIEEEMKQEMKDDGTPVLDETGNPLQKVTQKLKYPNGRKIVVAGGVLLEDGPMEYDDGLFPFVKMVNYILPREFWGMGEVEQLEGPQKTFNKLISFTLDVMTLMGNPIWVVGNTANIDTDNLFNKPGLIVETDDPNAIRREPGVELQPFILQMIDRYKQYIDGISGETDLSRGAEPNDITAASAITALQDAQQTRLRLKSRNIDAFLNNFGKLYLSRVFQYYSVPRIVRVTGDDNAAQYFYFHVEKLDTDPNTKQPLVDENGQPTTKRFAVITDPKTQQARYMDATSDFDVKVSTGSSLPFAKEEKGQKAMDLFKLGIIDAEEVLKDLDYPNYEQVLLRVQQQKQQGAQGQMQQQQQSQQQMLGLQTQAKIAIKQAPQGPRLEVPPQQNPIS